MRTNQVRMDLEQTEIPQRFDPLETLRPYCDNARTHSKRQIQKIAASLEEFGWTNLITVDENNMALAGHGRMEAARLLGLKNVPVRVLSDLTEAQRRAYIIADNALAEKAGWSRSMLRLELKGLIELGYNTELTGFNTIEIDTSLIVEEETADAVADTEAVELPDDRERLNQAGDHWILGNINSCAATRGTAMSFLNGLTAELVFTDPPSNCRIAGNVSGQARPSMVSLYSAQER